MKSSWLIILLIIVVGSTINLGSTIKFGTPSIELVGNEEFAGKNGDVFIYSIKLRSNENLINFKVVPNIIGKNQDCEFNYVFDENTNQAFVNYIYVLPEELEDISEVILTFTLSDSKESNIRTKVININNELNFADGKNETLNKSEI
ncbi:MAG: hypothetical protein DRI95_06730 [Bacteroidetes bacterium]|nr:MAG: hypothetical protein DRI95_06730 [Bacteroidota bacterium]RLD84247.1 MAG: hypothetical protein DRJ07_05235 [Bacteroidota bacterium]